jgi:hypothetical protein
MEIGVVSQAGSVLLETYAQAEAIVCEVDNNYGEREFIVDRRRLGWVRVRASSSSRVSPSIQRQHCKSREVVERLG